jgi:hypothetical protein
MFTVHFLQESSVGFGIHTMQASMEFFGRGEETSIQKDIYVSFTLLGQVQFVHFIKSTFLIRVSSTST